MFKMVLMMRKRDEFVFKVEVGFEQFGRNMQVLVMRFYQPEENLKGGGFSCAYEMLLDEQVLDEQVGYGDDSFQAVYEAVYLAKDKVSLFVISGGCSFYYLNEDGTVNSQIKEVSSLFSGL